MVRLLLVGAAAVALAGCGSDGNGGSPTQAATFTEVQEILEQRCVPCHSMNPTQPGVFAPPASLELDKPVNITTLKDLIYERIVVRKDMPDVDSMGEPNATGMTDEERARFASWYKAGAKT